LLEFAWIRGDLIGHLLNLICLPFDTAGIMTLDEKIRFGMVALSGASLVFASLGLHVNPLTVAGGMGGT
jgi:hypothetical protein